MGLDPRPRAVAVALAVAAAGCARAVAPEPRAPDAAAPANDAECPLRSDPWCWSTTTTALGDPRAPRGCEVRRGHCTDGAPHVMRCDAATPATCRCERDGVTLSEFTAPAACRGDLAALAQTRCPGFPRTGDAYLDAGRGPIASDPACRGACWLEELAARHRAMGAPGDPAPLAECRYRGQPVYVTPARSAGEYATLYDACGRVVCQPSGGPQDRGDGRCAQLVPGYSDCTAVVLDAGRH